MIVCYNNLINLKLMRIEEVKGQKVTSNQVTQKTVSSLIWKKQELLTLRFLKDL